MQEVGSLIPGNLIPQDKFLQALEDLLGSYELRENLGRLIKDPRLDSNLWETLFHRELLQLYQWCARRLLFSARSRVTDNSFPRAVLSLLPRTAFAAHLLRRAIPFAALGVYTSCGFPLREHEHGARITRILAKALCLEDHLVVEPEECGRAVRSFGRQEAVIIVTGRRSTIEDVARNAECRVVGCAGKCSILISKRLSSVVKIHRALTAKPVLQSCNRLRAVFICQRLSRGALAYPAFKQSEAKAYKLGEILSRLHPSVVLTPETDSKSHAEISEWLCGYKVITCAQDGSSSSGIGFGADPIYCWPGDYLL